MKPQLNLFATCPKGLELLLVDELKFLGATHAAEKLAGVTFTGDMELAYKACLWSRLANRILLPLAKFPAATPEALYAGVQTIAWDEHVAPEGTLAVNFSSSRSQIIHTLFGAQKVKDAIVDQLREKHNARPTVQKFQPDLSVNVYLDRDEAIVSIDLSGESLHRRSYRTATGPAPLKENLAAAILVRANWPAIAKTGGSLLDPMCGSGTLVIEAAFMAADIAPGLLRDYFGFLGWQQFDENIWQALVAEAQQRSIEGIKHLPKIIGYDMSKEMVAIAIEHVENAGLQGYVHIEKRELNHCEPPESTQPGLFVTNPPYGERLGDINELQDLYKRIADKLKESFGGWEAAVFTDKPELGRQMGLRARRMYALFNGALPCKLLLFTVNPEWFITQR